VVLPIRGAAHSPVYFSYLTMLTLPRCSITAPPVRLSVTG